MWKTIPFERNYEVSTFGEVRNKTSKHVKSLRLSKNGYYRVTLYPSGKTYFIHKLVAETFIEKIDGKPYVNHKDGDKLNNSLHNLEWCSPKENTHHAIENGLYVPKDISGVKNPMSKFTKEDVDLIRKKYSEGMSISDISKFMKVPYERTRRAIRGQHY